jgi:hypothetical protein
LSELGKQNLYEEHDLDDLRTLYERFGGAAATKFYFIDVPLERLFYLRAELEALLSVPNRFIYGCEKIRGVERPLPKQDPMDFTNAIIADISTMLMKANKSGKIGYLDTLNN